MTHNRRTVLTGLGAIGATAIAGAGTTAAQSDSNTPTDESVGGDAQARLRVAHLSPDAPNVDVHLDGETVLEDVAFRTVSAYLTVPAGSPTVAITAAGSDTVVFEGTVPLEGEMDYTVAAVGDLAEETFRPLVLTDTNRSLPDAVAQVRVVHASPDAPGVAVTTDATPAPLTEDLEFGAVGTYNLALAGDASVAVRPADADPETDPVAEASLSLEGGTTYTVFAAGYLTPDDEPAHEPFGLVPATGRPRDVVGPDDARVRVAHLSPDTPAVDVYLDDSRVLADVAFETISAYLPVPAGRYTVRVTPAGAGIENAVIEQHVTVEAGGAYTVAAVGESSDHIRAAVFEDHLGTEAGSALVRVIHASPDAPAVDVSADGGESDIIDGLAFEQATEYLSLSPGRTTLTVTSDTPADTAVGEFDVTLQGNRVYTVFAAGYLTTDDEPTDEEFRLLPTVDAGPGNG